MASLPKIVIVGGAFAGIHAAQQLDKQLGTSADITLIDARDGFHMSIAGPRAYTESGWAAKTWLPFNKVFSTQNNRRIIQGLAATSISPKAVTLADSTTVEFDYALIATGGWTPGRARELTKKEYIAEYERRLKDIVDAKTVLIVGGGATGVETAGEIKTDYPDKRVVLVHSGSELIGGTFSSKFKARVLSNITKLGVEVILNDRIDTDAFDATGYSNTERTLKTTNGGIEITSDVQILATGQATYNGGWARSLGPDVVDDHNQIRVEPTLQVVGFEHIFAAGDVANITYGKTAYNAKLQGGTAAKNIKKLIDRRDSGGTPKLEHNGPPSIVAGCVVAGRRGGAVQMGPLILGNWVATKAKATHLMLDSMKHLE
ncbi:Apoptosis-inducing factor 2 [Borealophlyctis nickersoniae]|nr:Apoptosis-inducing factor 2 [Borealophlyctis nickersoniae]